MKKHRPSLAVISGCFLVLQLIAVLYGVLSIAPRVEAQTHASGPSTLTGMIGYFNGTTCPAGWAEFTSARGYYIVGRVSGGTLATGVGTVLTDQENRAAGIHGHTATSTTPTITVNQGNVLGWQSSSGDAHASGFSVGDFTASTLSATSSTPTITVANSSGVAGTNAPYIQLLVCKHN